MCVTVGSDATITHYTYNEKVEEVRLRLKAIVWCRDYHYRIEIISFMLKNNSQMQPLYRI
jgi:hypothetical protein